MDESNGKVSQKDFYNAMNQLKNEILDRFDKLEERLDKDYTKRAEFLPVKQTVDAITNRVTLFVVAVLMGILALLISHVIPGFKI